VTCLASSSPCGWTTSATPARPQAGRRRHWGGWTPANCDSPYCSAVLKGAGTSF
jgi:hypothetical protein